MPVAKQVRGRDGRLLGEVRDGSPRAHLGTAIASFPNFFMMLGPNTGLGHSSMVYMAESQIATRVGGAEYALLRLAPRRLVHEVVDWRVRRHARSGGFEGSRIGRAYGRRVASSGSEG